MIADFNVRNEALAESPVQQLKARLAGELILPSDASYDDQRAIFVGNVDKRPAMIVRAADAIDVIRGVNLAREQGLTVAIRSGGHSFAGFSTIDGGMLLDLSGLKSISIDP